MVLIYLYGIEHCLCFVNQNLKLYIYIYIYIYIYSIAKAEYFPKELLIFMASWTAAV